VIAARAIQTAFAWEAGQTPGEFGPDEIVWAPAGRALAFEPGRVYILALQVALKAKCSGAWYLQYQENYDRGQAGEWTNVTNEGVWKTARKPGFSLRNARKVRPQWYSMPVAAGCKAATGEFADDNDGLRAVFPRDRCVELWYAIRAEREAAGHRYRFRVKLGDVAIEYQAYPLANHSAK
jgi:hypothetical protein